MCSLARSYYLSCRLSSREYEDYKRALYHTLDISEMREGFSRSDLFRLFLARLPKVEISSVEAEGLAMEYASLIKP